MDFSVINSQLCNWVEENWDHKMILWQQDPDAAALTLIDETVVTVPFNPTAENLAWYLVEVIGRRMLGPYGVILKRVDIEETRKCTASYERE